MPRPLIEWLGLISKVTITHEFDKVWFDLVKEAFMAIEVFSIISIRKSFQPFFFCCKMMPKSNWHTVNCFSFWKLFNTNFLFDDMFLLFHFSCLSYLITSMMLWLIYIFLSSSFIFFYHWSSRRRIADQTAKEGETMGWNFPVLPYSDLFVFSWLLARATLLKP